MSTPQADKAHGTPSDEARALLFGAISDTASEPSLGSTQNRLIELLRTAHYCINHFIDDVFFVKNTIIRESDSYITEYIKRLDIITRNCLAATAVIHENVLEDTRRGYVEVNADGRILHANYAFQTLISNPIGLDLATLFEDETAMVQRALAGAPDVTRLHRLELRTPAGLVPVSADFGPIRIDGVTLGGYAIIVDIRPFISAQERGFDAAELGIVRLDQHHRVLFANSATGRLLDSTPPKLNGRSLFELFPSEPARKVLADAQRRLEENVGSDVTLEFVDASGRRHPLYLGVSPEFDVGGRRIGAIIGMRSRWLEDARDRLHRACESYLDPDDLVRVTLPIINEVVPFDLATISVYGEDMHFARTLHTFPEQAHWTARWIPVPESLRAWIRGEEPWAPDLQDFLARLPDAGDLRGEPIVRDLIEMGYKGFVCLPVQQTDQVTIVLSLLSNTAKRLGPEEYAWLNDIDAASMLRMIDNGHLRRRRMFERHLVRAMAEAKDMRHLARVFIDRVASFFAWEHVSIFRVNRLQEQFELLEQVALGVDFKYSDSYTQPMSEGMLAAALSRQDAVCLDDTAAPDAQVPYRREWADARSALCIPIVLDGKISWILNAECRDTDVFHGPDREMLLDVVTSLKSMLERVFHALLVQEIIQATREGIVVVSATGKVRSANAAAQHLLGAIRAGIALKDKLLRDFGSTEQDRECLSRAEPGSCCQIELLGCDNEVRPALASPVRPEEQYDHTIWLLTDLRAPAWQVDLTYVRETVSEVAQQTRVPLVLAGSLVRRITRLLEDKAVHGIVDEIVDKVVRQIDKAEITYERLIDDLNARREHKARREPIDLNARLNALLGELPRADRHGIRFQRARNLPRVQGDPVRLDFVFRSTLAYLLTVRQLDKRVQVSTTSTRDGVSVKLRVTRVPDADLIAVTKHPLEAAEVEARARATLSEEKLAAIAKEHGGTFRPMRSSSGDGFELWLPIADANADMKHWMRTSRMWFAKNALGILIDHGDLDERFDSSHDVDVLLQQDAMGGA